MCSSRLQERRLENNEPDYSNSTKKFIELCEKLRPSFRQPVNVNVYACDVFIFDEVFYEQRQRSDELFNFGSDYYERFSNECK